MNPVEYVCNADEMIPISTGDIIEPILPLLYATAVPVALQFVGNDSLIKVEHIAIGAP